MTTRGAMDREVVGRTGHGLLTVGAVLGTLCLIAAVICLVLGVRPLIFLSGSMSPTIPAGSVGFVHEVAATDVEVGDIVSVHDVSGHRVTHRVIDVVPAADERVALTLQGDANDVPDAEPYVVRSADRLIADVPWLGHPISWLSTPLGLVVLGAVAAGVIGFTFRRSGERGGRHLRLGGLPAVAATVALVITTQPTSAYFSDSGMVRSDTVATHGVTSQAQPLCQNVDGILVLGNIARMTWQHVDARYEYAWQLINASTGAVASSGTVGAGVPSGGTVTLDISTGLIGLNTNYNVVVRARLVSSSTWIAPTTTTTPVRRVSILVIGAAFRCGHT